MRALGPPSVDDERTPTEHVEEDHGHHGRDDRGGVVDHGVDEGHIDKTDRSVERGTVRRGEGHARQLLEAHEGTGDARSSAVLTVEEVLPGALLAFTNLALLTHGRNLQFGHATVNVLLAAERPDNLEGFIVTVIEDEPARRIGREPEQAQDEHSRRGLEGGSDLPTGICGLLRHGLVDDASDQRARGETELDGSDEEASEGTGSNLGLIRWDDLEEENRPLVISLSQEYQTETHVLHQTDGGVNQEASDNELRWRFARDLD